MHVLVPQDVRYKMPAKIIDILGQRFGRLLVIERLGKKPGITGRAIYWLCECDCGSIVEVSGVELRRGNTVSCGCYSIDRSTIHNGRHTRLYSIWGTLVKRCENNKYKGYKNYGGRGITLCKEWREFKNFQKWARESGYEDTLTIDRIDNNGNYCPENCRWVDMKVQNRNKRSNRIISFGNDACCMSEWGERIGEKGQLIRDRIDKLGWTIKEALTTPKGQKRN